MDSAADLNLPEKIKKRLEQAVKTIRSLVPHAEILLFGSLAQGDWLEESDIDLIIISDNFKETNYITRVYTLKKGLTRIHIIPLTKKEFEERRRGSVIIEEALTHAIKIT